MAHQQCHQVISGCKINGFKIVSLVCLKSNKSGQKCDPKKQLYALSLSVTHFVERKDLDKLNLVKLAYGGLVLGLCKFAPAASKNDAHFKNGQK